MDASKITAGKIDASGIAVVQTEFGAVFVGADWDEAKREAMVDHVRRMRLDLFGPAALSPHWGETRWARIKRWLRLGRS